MDREVVLAVLRQNDPDRMCVSIDLQKFSDDVGSLSEALQANPHVNMIDLDFCDLVRSNANWDSLLRVIAERENLEKVDLHDHVVIEQRNPPDRIIPFLLAIQKNRSVVQMEFYCLQLSGDSMASFLDAATSLRELSIYSCNMEVPADALAIAAALQRNTNIQGLKLTFLDEEILIPVLDSLASEQSTSKLQSLGLTMCSVHQRERKSLRSAILSLLPLHSLLRSLELSHSDNLSHYGFETSLDFAGLFTAVERSPLENLTIECLRSRESCMALFASIPKMQLRTLRFDLFPDHLYNIQDVKGGIIDAVKRNASLRSVMARRDILEDWFDEEDGDELIPYCERNEFLAQWIETPAAVTKAAWPVALCVAQMTGANTVFGILQVLAPSMGPFAGEQCRKRRRPDFYVPS